MVGFKDFVSAQITLAGVELLHRIRQGQFALRKLGVAEKTAARRMMSGTWCSANFESDVGLKSGDSAGYWLTLPGTYRHGQGMATLGLRSYGRPVKAQ
jgi:hypothetical protein